MVASKRGFNKLKSKNTYHLSTDRCVRSKRFEKEIDELSRRQFLTNILKTTYLTAQIDLNNEFVQISKWQLERMMRKVGDTIDR